MSEQFYDEHIAPELAKLGKLCQDKNVPFCAVVEYAPGKIARTEYPGPAGMEMQIAQMAARCNGNVDALFIGIQKYAAQHGHNSVFLKLLEPKP